MSSQNDALTSDEDVGLSKLHKLQQNLLDNFASPNVDLVSYSTEFTDIDLVEMLRACSVEEQALLLQEQLVWFENMIILIKRDRENIAAELEKIQLAKKVKASYHSVQKG